jgi:hypothetical protein
MRATLARLLLAATLASCSSLIGLEEVEGPEFEVTLTPAQLTVRPGRQASFVVETRRVSGNLSRVALSTGAMPAGVQASVSPASVSAGESATLTLSAAADAAQATMSIEIIATADAMVRRARADLVIVQRSDFAVAITPRQRALPAGMSTTLTVTTTVTAGEAETVGFAATGLPQGVTASFSPSQVSAGGATTLTLTAERDAPRRDETAITVVATSDSAQHQDSATIAVTHDFSVVVDPGTATVFAGGTVSVAVRTSASAGPAQVIALSVHDLPAGVSASFTPATVAAGDTATLVLVTTPSAAQGSHAISVRGAAASGTHEVTASLALTPPRIVNGTFETGTLAGWQLRGDADSTAWHLDEGRWVGWVGSAYGNAAMYQTFAVPSTGQTTLTYSVWPSCIDPQNDWQAIDILDEGLGIAQTLAFGCYNDQQWVDLSVDLTPYAGRTIGINFEVYDYSGPATLFFIDDVALINR